MTSVFAEALEWDALMRAIRGGRIVVHERGTFVDFSAAAANGTRLGGVGDRIAPAADATVEFRGVSPHEQELRLVHIAPDACHERRQVGRDVPPLVDQQALLSKRVCASGACQFDERVSVRLEPGLYFATVGEFATAGLNARDVAVTNVLTVAAAVTR